MMSPHDPVGFVGVDEGEVDEADPVLYEVELELVPELVPILLRMLSHLLFG